MKICFLLWSPDISGGTNVIFEHATRLMHDNEVFIISQEQVDDDRLSWFPEARKLNWITFEQAEDFSFDICIATWWRTVFSLKHIKSSHYAYFVQSIESRFYPENEIILRNLVELTYSLDLHIITEANWIRNYLYEKYNKTVFLVLNGIRKDYFNNQIEPFSSRNDNTVRVLVEGPLGVSFKNTELALDLAIQSKADEVWLLTSTDIGYYPKVNKLYSRLPVTEVGKVYSSCDILVKLSTVEGMFGPPLEAFHCGATSVTYDVTGYDEYIVPEKNALVSFSRKDQDIIDKINYLVDNKEILEKLKREALLTANTWPTWENSSNEFHKVCKSINDLPKNQDITYIGYIADLLWEQYEKSTSLNHNHSYISTKDLLKRKIGDKIYNKSPKLYSMLRKIKWSIYSIIKRD